MERYCKHTRGYDVRVANHFTASWIFKLLSVVYLKCLLIDKHHELKKYERMDVTVLFNVTQLQRPKQNNTNVNDNMVARHNCYEMIFRHVQLAVVI